MTEKPWHLLDGWFVLKDGDPVCKAMYDRHYSKYNYKDGRYTKLFLGPGEKFVLLQSTEDVLCCWRKFIDDSGQTGVNCAIYRNESKEKASILLKSAMQAAWFRWPKERLYTYVDPTKVKPTMVKSHPVWGWCFYKAGWSFAGLTGKGLHILEVYQK